MNTDRLNSMKPQEAAQSAYAQISAVQHLPPDQQVAGAVLLLRAMAEELRLDLSQLMQQAARVMDDADTYYNREVSALRMYVRKELK